jgi:hypothetical protein
MTGRRLNLRLLSAGYFFFAGELAGEVFGAVVQDSSAAGGGIFLGCFGFFASRLPRN